MRPAQNYWSWMPAVWDIWFASGGRPELIHPRAEQRFFEVVQFARTHSPFYAESYRSLPQAGFEPRDLPPVTRETLMERFDDWVTDSELTRDSVERFICNPQRAGRPHLGRYGVWTSSGTTGQPGLFVHDGFALAVYDALDTVRLGRSVLAPGFVMGELLAGGRYAMVGATGGHFAGVASVERLRLLLPSVADRLQTFSILEPLQRLVQSLNSYQPSFVATYPTAGKLLAQEQRAGRLRIHPSVICVGGETSSAVCRAEIAAAFRCRVFEVYGASECMSIGCGCACGSLHLNSDWVMLDPVDKNYRPVAPGERSHTVLLTNLANRVQPIIRYDLGDSVTVMLEPCACGSPFPVICVEGRSDETLRLRSADGTCVELLPLALATVVEEFSGVHQFQIIQTAPDALGVRLNEPERTRGSTVWRNISRALRAYLDAQGLPTVTIYRDLKPPQRTAKSGKLKRVVRKAW